jgi:nucleotide-binding universal stress UspA family protein
MQQRILLGIDANFSPATQYALRSLATLLQPPSPTVSFIFLHVIPLSHVIFEPSDYYTNHFVSFTASLEQRKEAETVLQKAHTFLLQHMHIEEGKIEHVIAVGVPPEELARVARERQAHLIVVGNQGNTFSQRFRRLVNGSVSHKIMHIAPCPVMVASPPLPLRPDDLVSWYEHALHHYLHEHEHELTVLTTSQVASLFLPDAQHAPGQKETAAARIALDKLVSSGLLCRHVLKDEIHYVND